MNSVKTIEEVIKNEMMEKWLIVGEKLERTMVEIPVPSNDEVLIKVSNVRLSEEDV